MTTQWLQAQDSKLTDQYMQLLAPAEQQYVSESTPQVRTERLLARTLQRTVLARYLPAWCPNQSQHPVTGLSG